MEGPFQEAVSGQPRVFGRYTEPARVVIYFARREANLHGSPKIGTEHLLLGLLIGDRRLARSVLGSGGFIKRYVSSASAIRSISRKVPAVGNAAPWDKMLPLTLELRYVLGNAASEADRVGDQFVRPTHLLLGLLEYSESVGAKLLNQEGVTLESVRARFGQVNAGLRLDWH
jgi:ATP-dependent Clp protease ATP-binding subunit ClpC